MSKAALQSGAPAATPAAPAAPAAPAQAPVITVPNADGTHHVYTTADVAALNGRKAELSNQLNSATSRRHEVQRALRGASGADKAGLEARLAVLDARIARLESDIYENSSQLASLDVTRLTSTQAPWNSDAGTRFSNNAMPLAIVFVLFVMCPIALSISRLIWKRGARASAITPASADTTQRLERMEQSMEAIAIEIERVSEGQRFVTRLLSESRPSGLGAGEPVMVPVGRSEQRIVDHL